MSFPYSGCPLRIQRSSRPTQVRFPVTPAADVLEAVLFFDIADISSGDYLRYVNIDWDYKYGQAGLIKMKMSSGDKCLDAGLSEHSRS